MQLRDINQDKYFKNLVEEICDLRGQHYSRVAGTGCDCVCYDCCFFRVLKLSIPIFGKLTLKAELSRFSRTLALLVESGISILKAIEISIPVLENEVIKNQLAQSYKDLEQGGSFGRSLKNSKLFPLFMTNLIIVGEESGKLGEALAEVANSYEKDTDEAMKIMASLLEPLMILGMGLMVGFIVVAMLLPIFEINVMVR